MRFTSIIFISFFAVMILTACQNKEVPTPPVPDGHLAVIEIMPRADGSWDVEMTFAKPQKALIFSRSIGDYRTSTWTSQSETAAIKRLGGFDAIIFDQPGTHASFTVKPYSENLRGDYTPALIFSNGASALYTGQFELLEIADEAAIIALNGQLNNWEGTQYPLTLKLSADGKVLNQGVWEDTPLSVSYPENEGYIFMGEGKITEGRDFIGVLDEGLPDWLKDDFDQELNGTFEALRKNFGSELPRKASLLFAFGGYEGPGFSNSGGALPGPALALNTSGAALQDFNPDTYWAFQWFFAHEGAHLFQNRNFETYPIQPWLHEGHANAVGYDILRKRGALTERAVLSQNKEDEICFDALRTEPKTGAGDVSTHYECGALIWRIAVALTPKHDLYSLWDAAQERINSEGGRLAQDRLFGFMVDFGADPITINKLRAFAMGPVQDPKSYYQDLHNIAENGH